MCGIGAIFGWRGSRNELEQAIQGMWQALVHRGPDDAGIWISPDGTTALCHRRLAILDLSPGGHQPMASASGQLQIVFNGEIYNYLTLREELATQGVAFRGQSDTEVILAGFERHGPDFVNRLEGMFAFAIYQPTTGKAWLARDSFGIKPLYQSLIDGTLFIASEVRAVLASGRIPRRLCGAGVQGYLHHGSVPEPLTLIEGIRMFPPATVGEWRSHRGLTSTTYWSPRFAQTESDDAVNQAREALRESVERHLISDVPVGIFLSGGLDSYAIASLAASGDGRMQSYSVGVDDPTADESREAATAARRLGLVHHPVLLRAQEAAGFFEAYLAAQDQPSIDGFNTYCVAQFARSTGAKVVLSGLGGDELFGGYGSFQLAPRLTRLGCGLRNGSIPTATAGRLLESFGTNPKLHRAGEWLQQKSTLVSSMNLIRGIFSMEECRRLMTRIGVAAEPEPLVELPNDPTPQDTISRLEIQGYMRNQLLRDGDTMSMAHGLELRLPLVDRRLFESLAKISSRQRLQAGKRLLADAIWPLPHHLVNGKKKGFQLPFDRWLTTPVWQERIQEICSRYSLAAAPWYRIWALLALENWLARHLKS